MSDEQNTTQKTTDYRWLWVILGIIIILLGARWLFQSADSGLSLFGTSTTTPETPNTGASSTESTSSTSSSEEATSTPNAGPATVSAIVQNPNDYADKIVTVPGTVEKVYDQRFFSVTERGATGGRMLFVVSPRPASILEGDNISISGTVKAGVITSILSQVGIQLPEPLTTMVGVRAVIIADSIKKAQ